MMTALVGAVDAAGTAAGAAAEAARCLHRERENRNFLRDFLRKLKKVFTLCAGVTPVEEKGAGEGGPAV